MQKGFIKNKADFDLLYQTMNVTFNGKIMRFKASLWETLASYWQRFRKWFVGQIYVELKPSLGDLTIGALNDIAECKTPQEVMNTIFADLGIRKQPNLETYIQLFFQWDKEIKQIEQLFKNTEIQAEGIGNGAFVRISKQLNINPFAILIDSMARRYGILPIEASKLKWAEVYFALMIDKQNYLVEREMQKQYETEMKRK